MSINKVQLKQEELVDSSVVFTDINPITDTESVSDVSSGSTMKETIDRIWNAINTKLSRVVNSVNGRTGVVIIDANDVGLGNVDNVSYQEIKEWVLEQIRAMLNGKHLRLYNTIDEVEGVCGTGDKMYDGVPFYAMTGETGTGDKRAYIGYYIYNDETESLSYDAYPINVVGHTDNSIIYNETVVKNSTTIDMSGGGIAVNIHPDEEALYVENAESLSKANSGLRIDPAKLNGGMIFSDSLFQSDNDDTKALLASTSSSQGLEIRVFINDIEMSSDDPGRHYYLNTKQEKPVLMNTLVFTNFKALTQPDSGLKDSGLMNRQPALGVVTSAPTKSNPEAPYVIKFYSIKQMDSYGLGYYTNHETDPAEDSIQGIIPAQDSYGNNYSGITLSPSNMGMITTPWMSMYFHGNIDYTDEVSNYGFKLHTDSTISQYPRWLGEADSSTGQYGKYSYGDGTSDCYGSKIAINWCQTFRWRNDYKAASSKSKFSITSINENKLVLGLNQPQSHIGYEFMEPPYKFYNISGLRQLPPEDFTGISDRPISLKLKQYGILDEKDATGNELKFPNAYWRESGGLSINIGKFLEILPTDTKTANTYNDGGKVQVRIGNGLRESTNEVVYDLTLSAQELVYPDVNDWERQIGFPGGDRDLGVNDITRKKYYVQEPGEERLDAAVFCSNFTILQDKPNDWIYGSAFYYQKVICGYYHNDSFYYDNQYQEEIVPSDKWFYIDRHGHGSGSDVFKLKLYQYDGSSQQYVPLKFVYVLHNADQDMEFGYIEAYSKSAHTLEGTTCPDWDEMTAAGIEYYYRTPIPRDEVVNYGYTKIYEVSSNNRIELNLKDDSGLYINSYGQLSVSINEDSGLYIDESGKLSYRIPTYTVGHTYAEGQLIRNYATNIYITITSFTATSWDGEGSDPGDRAKCIQINGS